MKDGYLFKQGEPFEYYYLILYGSFQQSLKKDDKVYDLFSLQKFFCLGIEEGYCKSTKYLSTVQCTSALIEEKDPETVDIYKNLIFQEEKEENKDGIILKNAVVYRVKKDVF